MITPERHGRPPSTLRSFLASEAAGGALLVASAALAFVIANSRLAGLYREALETHIGPLALLHWINDGLMSVFFLLVGLEIKRELFDGHLRHWSARALPGFAAFGGMAVPSLIYAALNVGLPTLRGWAIPAATDIAFALGVLALLGDRAPGALKVFLTALAILDDLGAIVIIGVFYSRDLSPLSLALAGAALAALYALNRLRVSRLPPYLAGGALLWFFVLRSGVHATIAGVLLACAIPLRPAKGDDGETSPLHRLEKALQPYVAYAVLPLFGLANAGVALDDADFSLSNASVLAGVAAGLFLGKQGGVFAALALAIKTGVAARPAHVTWVQLYGVAALCGIGFTMSLFIGQVAFDDSDEAMAQAKIGVLVGSLLSIGLGTLVLLLSRTKPEPHKAWPGPAP